MRNGLNGCRYLCVYIYWIGGDALAYVSVYMRWLASWLLGWLVDVQPKSVHITLTAMVSCLSIAVRVNMME